MLNERDTYPCSPDNCLLGNDISQGLPEFLVWAWRVDSWISAADTDPGPLLAKEESGRREDRVTSARNFKFMGLKHQWGSWAKRKPFSTQRECLEHAIHLSKENSGNQPPLCKNTSFFWVLPWTIWKASVCYWVCSLACSWLACQLAVSSSLILCFPFKCLFSAIGGEFGNVGFAWSWTLTCAFWCLTTKMTFHKLSCFSWFLNEEIGIY